MKLNKAEAWALKVQEESKVKSDGCTGIDWFVRIFIPWIRTCCITHDWLLIKKKLPRADADALIRECIESKSDGWWSGWWFWSVAFVFYLFTRLRSNLGSVPATFGFLWVAAIVAFVIYQVITTGAYYG